MKREVPPHTHFVVGNAILCVFMLLFASCDNSSKTPHKAIMPASASFKPVSYSLARLEKDSLFLDSLRTLPRADSLRIRHIISVENLDKEFLNATGFYRYQSFTLGSYRAEVVAMISEFNSLSGSLELLLFTPANQWVSTTTLASHYDEAGGSEDKTSIQNTPTTFVQQKVAGGVKESRPKDESQPSVYLGNETITTHSLLALKAGKMTVTRLDSVYRLTKE